MILNFKYLLLCCLLFPAIAISLPTVKDYSASPAVSMVAISPDGKLLALRSKTGNLDAIKIISLDEKKQVRSLDVSSVNPHRVSFLSNNKLLLIISEEMGLRNYLGRHEISSALVYELETQEFKQLLTPGDVIHKGQTGLGRISGVQEDGRYVYMPAYVAENRYDRGPDLSLIQVDINKPRRPKVYEQGTNHTVGYFIRSNGELLARQDYNNFTNLHVLYSYANGKRKAIFEQNTPIREVSFVGVSPGYESIVMLKEDEDSGLQSYFTVLLTTGAIEKVPFGKAEADIESIYRDHNQTVYGVKYSGFMPSYYFFDKKINSRMQDIVKEFEGNAVHLVDWSDGWSNLLVYVSGPTAPGDYWLFNAEGVPTFIASAYPKIKEDQIHPIGQVVFEARDGLKIPTLITIPRSKASAIKKLPAILFPHGGPAYYDQIEFDWLAQAFANEGYLVIQPQFRGSRGFGAQHKVAGHGQWGRKMQDDLSDSVDFFVKKGMVDPDKVCIVGGSYGGYAALSGGAFTPELYKCVISINGVSDLNEMLKYEKSDHGRHHEIYSYWKKLINLGSTDKDVLEEISPSAHAKNFAAPILLIHGEEDKVVLIDQSKVMYQNLKKKGKNVTFIRLKEESHYIESAKNRTEMLDAMLSFIRAHI